MASYEPVLYCILLTQPVVPRMLGDATSPCHCLHPLFQKPLSPELQSGLLHAHFLNHLPACRRHLLPGLPLSLHLLSPYGNLSMGSKTREAEGGDWMVPTDPPRYLTLLSLSPAEPARLSCLELVSPLRLQPHCSFLKRGG